MVILRRRGKSVVMKNDTMSPQIQQNRIMVFVSREEMMGSMNNVLSKDWRILK